MTVPLAHAMHWGMWALYLLPVAIVLIASARSFAEQRRERAGEKPS